MTRSIEYFSARAQEPGGVLHDALEQWQPILAHDADFTDDILTKIEDLQRDHAQRLEPLHAEYDSLRKEWNASNPNTSQRAAVRARAAETAALVEQLQETERIIADRVTSQMHAITASSQEIKRGRKMTRDSGATRDDDAQYMDRQA